MRSNQKRKATSRLKGMAQLWSASERGDARAVAALLDGDRTSVAVNHAGEWGWTPLFVARGDTWRWCRCCWPSRAST